jgi:hypothetical protein
LQALQSAQRSRKVLAAALVVAQAAPVVAPEVALVAARALVQAAVPELELAVLGPARAEPADPVAAASRMSSGADKAPPVPPACATRQPRHPTAPCRVASGSWFAIFKARSLLLRA